MTAPVVIPLNDLFAPAIEAVNVWRGRCLASFAKAELAASEALATLGPASRKPLLPLLVGQRFAALATLLEAQGDSAEALKAIRAFAAHDDLRAFLCHGDSRITLDRQGRWLAVFTLVRPADDGVERRFLLVNDEEAMPIAKAVDRDRRKLIDRLRRAVPIGLSEGDRALRVSVSVRTG